MRVLFRFPDLADDITPNDPICPCLKLQNTYNGTTRITLHIGALRFVCTNLAVGGGGVFAGGFMSVHIGEIPLENAAAQLTEYLASFSRIVGLYRRWRDQPFLSGGVLDELDPLAARVRTDLARLLDESSPRTVYAAYNSATWYATHQMRSARGALNLLERVNRVFQSRFPVRLAA